MGEIVLFLCQVRHPSRSLCQGNPSRSLCQDNPSRSLCQVRNPSRSLCQVRNPSRKREVREDFEPNMEGDGITYEERIDSYYYCQMGYLCAPLHLWDKFSRLRIMQIHFFVTQKLEKLSIPNFEHLLTKEEVPCID